MNAADYWPERRAGELGYLTPEEIEDNREFLEVES